MKKFLSVIILICFSLGITSYAYNDITLTGVNDKVLLYESSYEPIVFAGRICVPYTVFSRDVGVSSVYNSERKVLTMYNFNTIITLDISAGTIQDENLNFYEGSAFFRGNVIYVPASVICNIFKLNFSNMHGDTEIVRISNQEAKLSNDVFKTLANSTYANMLNSNSQNDSLGLTSPPVSTAPSVTPDTSQPLVTPEIPIKPILNVDTIKPIFISNISKDIIDNFSDGQLTYYIDENSFENTEILRYAYIKNHSIGIFIPENVDNITNYINNINQKLFDTLGFKTRILLFENQETDIENFVSSQYISYERQKIIDSSDKSININLSDTENINSFIDFCKSENIIFQKIDEFNN